jgi:hypothetical protein
MVTYHYVKIYVSIIIQLEVININVQNFKFPKGFYSNPHPLWTPKNIAFKMAAKTQHKNGGGKNSTLSDIIKIWYVGR